jgi:glutamine amidotransferase
MIAIVDYGMANLRSVQKALEAVGHRADIIANPIMVKNAEKIILPGVGAFRDAIGRLKETGLDVAVKDHIHAGKPFLGICLGLQLLFERSHEDGIYEGLGIFKGDVVRFQDAPGLKIPHMGWNDVIAKRSHHVIADGCYYFVHSYYCEPVDDIVLGETDYNGPFAAAVGREKVFATQFHPEKSQRTGLALLKQFADLD